MLLKIRRDLFKYLLLNVDWKLHWILACLLKLVEWLGHLNPCFHTNTSFAKERMMDELLILLPVRIRFPFQSIGLRTLDHFMGNHFFYNYVTFDFLSSLKLPVIHVAEERLDKLRENNLQVDRASLCNGELVNSLHTCFHFSIHSHTHLCQTGKGEKNIWVNKLFIFSVLKSS